MIFTENKAINLYSSILGNTPKGNADALVKVGGESLSKFVPNINASKWNDECWLNINNKAVDVKAETQDFRDGKIDLIVGNDCHRYYIKPDGTLEYEIIFSSQPKPEILLDLQFSPGLDFFYQPKLTPEEISDGYYRPEHVEGSYAIYWKEKNNKYQTGKFGHLFRPWFLDSKGNFIWATGFVDPSANIISIRGDEDWLKAASYPITCCPNLCSSTKGASSASSTNRGAHHGTTDGTGGVTNYLHFWVYNGTDGSRYLDMAVYVDGGSLAPTTWLNPPNDYVRLTPGSGLDNQEHTVAYTATLAASTKFWVGHARSSSTLTTYYDTGDANESYAVGATGLISPFGAGANGTARHSSWADYAPVASGLSIPVINNRFQSTIFHSPILKVS